MVPIYLVSLGPNIGHVICCASAIYSGRVTSPSMQKVFNFSILLALLTLRVALRRCITDELCWAKYHMSWYRWRNTNLHINFTVRRWLLYVVWSWIFMFRLLSFRDSFQLMCRNENVDVRNKHEVDFAVCGGGRQASGAANILALYAAYCRISLYHMYNRKQMLLHDFHQVARHSSMIINIGRMLTFEQWELIVV